jgi:glycine/D-amino acid oxidase-like deaminating enzyme
VTTSLDTSTSLWTDTLPELSASDGPLDGSTSADIVIVGAGYTGLWTAYYLATLQPDARIMIVEAHHVGFGASGRNGGWCSALMPMSLTAIERRHDRDAAIGLQDAMIATLDEVTRVTELEGIDCQTAHAGTVTLARTRAQVQRLHHHLATMRAYGYGDEHERWMSAREAREVLRASDVLGAAFTPHCMTVHPGRLAHGLADACRRRGVLIHDRTTVTDVDDHGVLTTRGRITSPVVLLATEAYTSQLPGHRRDVVPIYSLMIATEPLPDDLWSTIGLSDRPTFHDERRLVIYGQRTADGRIAFGGRGAPYHFGSAISPAYDHNADVHAALSRALVDLFPTLDGVAITHRWGGPLAIPRDWHASVRFDATNGRGAAGGYVGDGVATANLAGRTLADLVLDRRTPLTTLAWVGHRSRRWEPEPLRWLSIKGALGLTRSLDVAEASGRRSPRVRTRLLDALTGQ